MIYISYIYCLNKFYLHISLFMIEQYVMGSSWYVVVAKLLNIKDLFVCHSLTTLTIQDKENDYWVGATEAQLSKII